MNSLSYISLLIALSIVGSSALSWNDCGAPLSRVISFQNIVAYPESPNSQDRLSLSVQATVMRGFSDASTNILITKDGELYLTVVGRSLCTILATTQTTITCPIAAGQYSFNYVYPLPTLPAGSYTISITFNDLQSGQSLGCASSTFSVSDPSSSATCTFTSVLNMYFGTTRLNTNAVSLSNTNNSWIQIGPYGNNAGSVASNFPWGQFIKYQATTDILDLAVDLSPYVWGLNGTSYSSVSASSVNSGLQGTLNSYRGDFVIGYRPYTGAPLSNIQIIASGHFDITYQYVQGRIPAEQTLYNGQLWFDPQYSQPVGFYYPLIFGGLNNYTISQQSDGSLLASGARTWCTCPIDACGICGGNGRQCAPSNQITTAAPRRHGLSDYDIAAIVIGAIAFLLLLIVLILALLLWRRGREQRTVRDDTDLAGPDKPDYGSMAINEVLADHGRPVIVNP